MSLPVELHALAPWVGLAATIVIVLAAVTVRRHHGLACLLTLVGLAASLALLPTAAARAPRAVATLLTIDAYTLFFVGLLIASALLVVLLSGRYMRACERHAEEYYLLLLLATLGAAVLVASRHFVALFLGLELLGVALYGLIAYVRVRGPCIEAGIKYLILAALSSAFLLFGVALLYARTGSLVFAEVAARLAPGGTTASLAEDPVALAGLALLLVGFGFKLAVVPFHMWTPDVYQGAPAPVTAFVATASKGAVLALLVRLTGLLPLAPGGPLWLLLAAIAVASMVIGNLLALRQDHLKRLLAYSSIAHLGYLLVAFLAGGERGVAAVAVYLVVYTVTTLGAFGVITVLSRPTREAANDGGAPAVSRVLAEAGDLDALEDYRGLGRRRPVLATLLAAMLLSLGGIPLTAGFIGKFVVVASGIGAALWTLVILLVVNSAIGIYYYLRVIVAMGMSPGAEAAPAVAPAPALSPLSGLALAVLAVLLLGLGVYPSPLLALARSVAAAAGGGVGF